METAVTGQTEHLTFSLTFHLLYDSWYVIRGSGSFFSWQSESLCSIFAREYFTWEMGRRKSRGLCNRISRTLERKEEEEEKKKESKARFQIFANNTRNTAYKTRWNIPSPPSRACLRYIGFCESINLAYVTSMLILMQRDCNAVFQHKTENILDSFYRRVLKMCRH